MKPAIRAACVSDIHLGHRKNPTSRIIQNLKRAFPDDASTAELDIIFFSGDVFDRLLSMPSDDADEIERWIKWFLFVCKKHDVLLRIVEGTPSHDWNQSRRFIQINELWGIGADVKYHESMAVEYIEKFDRHVLYIKDQYSDDVDKTLSDAKELIASKGLEKVDIGIMHGQFEFQVPPQANCPKHNSVEYSELVREFISIGHDHHFMSSGKIYAQGSFDRLAHGEEEAKGHIRLYLDGHGNHQATFVETEGAKRFVTIDCSDLNPEDSMEKINDVIKTLPSDATVRPLFEPGHALLASPAIIYRSWPEVEWSRFKVKKVKPTKDDDHTFSGELEFKGSPSIEITKSNIKDLLMDKLVLLTSDSRVLDSAGLLLDEVI